VRRTYVRVPPCWARSEHFPGNDRRYKGLREDQLPVTESLATTLTRVMPFWESHMKQDILNGENILVRCWQHPPTHHQ
jgi:2,3-bisphosphoglycerate-dependent phosphoglycerate mutase